MFQIDFFFFKEKRNSDKNAICKLKPFSWNDNELLVIKGKHNWGSMKTWKQQVGIDPLISIAINLLHKTWTSKFGI